MCGLNGNQPYDRNQSSLEGTGQYEMPGSNTPGSMAANNAVVPPFHPSFFLSGQQTAAQHHGGVVIDAAGSNNKFHWEKTAAAAAGLVVSPVHEQQLARGALLATKAGAEGKRDGASDGESDEQLFKVSSRGEANKRLQQRNRAAFRYMYV